MMVQHILQVKTYALNTRQTLQKIGASAPDTTGFLDFKSPF